MARRALSRLQDWLCPPVSSPSCFLSSPPHSMGRQQRGRPTTGTDSISLCSALTAADHRSSAQWWGCAWKKGNRTAFKWGWEWNKKKTGPKTNTWMDRHRRQETWDLFQVIKMEFKWTWKKSLLLMRVCTAQSITENQRESLLNRRQYKQQTVQSTGSPY